ncbi:MAG: hypothetical protein AAB499_00670 [Patescibacteria group bacterium]
MSSPAGKKSGTVKQIKDGRVILANGQETLTINRSQAPVQVQPGDQLTAEFYHLKDENRRRENLARAVLEDILGTR